MSSIEDKIANVANVTFALNTRAVKMHPQPTMDAIGAMDILLLKHSIDKVIFIPPQTDTTLTLVTSVSGCVLGFVRTQEHSPCYGIYGGVSEAPNVSFLFPLSQPFLSASFSACAACCLLSFCCFTLLLLSSSFGFFPLFLLLGPFFLPCFFNLHLFPFFLEVIMFSNIFIIYSSCTGLG